MEEHLLNYGTDPNIVTPASMSFGSILQRMMKREKNYDEQTVNKLEKIHQLAIKKGMK